MAFRQHCVRQNGKIELETLMVCSYCSHACSYFSYVCAYFSYACNILLHAFNMNVHFFVNTSNDFVV